MERGIPFAVKSVLLPQNKREIEKIEAWAKTIPSMTGPPSYATSLELRSRRDEAKNKLIASLRLPPEDKLAMIARTIPSIGAEHRSSSASSPDRAAIFYLAAAPEL